MWSCWPSIYFYSSPDNLLVSGDGTRKQGRGRVRVLASMEVSEAAAPATETSPFSGLMFGYGGKNVQVTDTGLRCRTVPDMPSAPRTSRIEDEREGDVVMVGSDNKRGDLVRLLVYCVLETVPNGEISRLAETSLHRKCPARGDGYLQGLCLGLNSRELVQGRGLKGGDRGRQVLKDD